MDTRRTRTLISVYRSGFAALLLGVIVVSQIGYDRAKPASTPASFEVAPFFVKMISFGFDSAIASFYWIPTMPQVIALSDENTSYVQNVRFVNDIDPKLSFPYAYSVITIPAFPRYGDRVNTAIEIGKHGIAHATPDWRIPFYIATNYFLELKDSKSALPYFDLAGRTPGIPTTTKRYALNFGISSNLREQTEGLWEVIYENATDEITKERAARYLERFRVVNYLGQAIESYKKTFGVPPKKIEDLVEKKIIPSIPKDPFGFEFVIINEYGELGIDLTKLPSHFYEEAN